MGIQLTILLWSQCFYALLLVRKLLLIFVNFLLLALLAKVICIYYFSCYYQYLQCIMIFQNLQLESQHACVHPFSLDELSAGGGLSTGSVLVIMFMVFILVYFGGGMLTLRLLRGAEGREMIPNIDFWSDLPYLVRVSIFFFQYGCWYRYAYYSWFF